MANLIVLEFPTAEGAETMLSTLENLQKQQLIQVQDAAIVTWPVGARKPKTRQLSSTTAAGALGGAFWGMLFGLLFFIPFFGLAVGAAVGAIAGHYAKWGKGTLDIDLRLNTTFLDGSEQRRVIAFGLICVRLGE